MFRGSPGLSADQLANITAAMGGKFDADTQQTVTQYYFTGPDRGSRRRAAHRGAAACAACSIPRRSGNKERGAIEQEVAQDLSNPDYVFYSKLLAAHVQGHAIRPRRARDAALVRQDHGEDAARVPRRTGTPPTTPSWSSSATSQPGDGHGGGRSGCSGTFPSKQLPARLKVDLQPVQAADDEPRHRSALRDRWWSRSACRGCDSPEYAAAQVLSRRARAASAATSTGWSPAGKALVCRLLARHLPESEPRLRRGGLSEGGGRAGAAEETREILAKTVKNGVSGDLVEAAKRHEVADAEFEKNSVAGLAAAWSQALAVEGRSSPEEDVRAISG